MVRETYTKHHGDDEALISTYGPNLEKIKRLTTAQYNAIVAVATFTLFPPHIM